MLLDDLHASAAGLISSLATELDRNPVAVSQSRERLRRALLLNGLQAGPTAELLSATEPLGRDQIDRVQEDLSARSRSLRQLLLPVPEREESAHV